MQVHFFGHACFQISTSDTTILFDPFLRDNPHQIITTEEVHPDFIFVSHAHADHLGDAVEIAKANGSQIISTFEVANLCELAGCKTHPMHIGGKHSFAFGSVRITNALHGCGVPGGHACGFIVNFFGKNIYFAGDTALFGDMELLGHLEKIDYAFLPIGDNFTMGPQDAALAAKMLQAAHVIPMHYDTWPLIAQDAVAFKKDVEQKYSIPVTVLKPGDILRFD